MYLRAANGKANSMLSKLLVQYCMEWSVGVKKIYQEQKTSTKVCRRELSRPTWAKLVAFSITMNQNDNISIIMSGKAGQNTQVEKDAHPP